MCTTNRVRVTLPVLLLAICTACSTTAPAGESLPPLATNTPKPSDLSLTVPKGNPADIDGTLQLDEWASAQHAVLVPEGELLLMHDGQHLYVGLRGRADSVGSVCIAQSGQVSVLHSSLGVGTAVYEPSEGSWQRVQDFRWIWWDEGDGQVASDQKSEFLRQNGWVASTMGIGSPGEMEYKIALNEGEIRLAVVYFTGDGSTEQAAWWPGQLDDSCRQAALIQGRAAATHRFQPAQWVSVTVLPGN